MEEKNKHGKRKYVDSYVRNEAGEFDYTGKYYSVDLPRRKIVSMRVTYWTLSVATAAAFLGAGLLNNEGSRVMYVILPYAVLFLPIVFMLLDVFRISSNKGKMTQKQFDHSVIQLKRVTLTAIALSFFSSVGDVFFIVLGHAAGNRMRELLFLGLSVAIFVLNVIFINVQSITARSVRIT